MKFASPRKPILLQFSANWIIAFSILILSARALGMAQPPNPLLAGFREGCTANQQPCWYGIRPGITPLADALQSLRERGYQIYEHVDPQVGHDDFIVVDSTNPLSCDLTLVPLSDSTTILRMACPGLRLGDLFTAFGVPDVVYNPLIYYRSGLDALIHTLAAYSPIEMIYLNSETRFPDSSHSWRGFLSWGRYQQKDG